MSCRQSRRTLTNPLERVQGGAECMEPRPERTCGDRHPGMHPQHAHTNLTGTDMCPQVEAQTWLDLGAISIDNSSASKLRVDVLDSARRCECTSSEGDLEREAVLNVGSGASLWTWLGVPLLTQVSSSRRGTKGRASVARLGAGWLFCRHGTKNTPPVDIAPCR
jgi:hypothetical protein